MAGSAWGETRQALVGTLLLARGDARGLGCFDASLDGFWRSFCAAVICYPFYLLLTFDLFTVAEWEAAGSARIIAVRTISYVISWAAFPLIILSLCRRVERDGHFLGFMVVYNWCQVPQIVLFAAIAAAQAGGLLQAAFGEGVELIAGVAALVYEGYIARVALDVSVSVATLVVLIDLLLATALSQVGASLY